MKKLFYIVLVIVVLLVIAQFVKQESAAPVPAEDVAEVVVEESTVAPDMMSDGAVVEEEAEDVVEANPEETADEDETIEMHIFNNKILFKYQNILFQSRLINGTYPNTANLLPEESLLKITTSINELYSVIDRASILTSDKEKNIVTLETNGNKLFIKSSSAEIGRVEEKMVVEKDNDEDIRISFVAKYMMEALKSFNEDEVEISFVGEIKPILLKNVNDDTLTQLVLPIRTY